MIELVDVGIALIETILSKLQNKVPETVVEAVQAAIDALVEHKNYLLTKANFEAQRG